MSFLTGIAIWGFLLVAGLEFATAWGVIAFALNYIPFVGPFIATVFPSIFAILQIGVLASGTHDLRCRLNLIQFLVGSYLEPRIAGAALVDVAVSRSILGVFLDVRLGPSGSLYRSADNDRTHYDLRTI